MTGRAPGGIVPPGRVCLHCGDEIHPKPAADCDEWIWVDSDGNATRSLLPDALKTREGWEELARRNVAAYSLIIATIRLGNGGFHQHMPSGGPPYPGEVPQCSHGPMRLAPSRWTCREDDEGCLERDASGVRDL